MGLHHEKNRIVSASAYFIHCDPYNAGDGSNAGTAYRATVTRLVDPFVCCGRHSDDACGDADEKRKRSRAGDGMIKFMDRGAVTGSRIFFVLQGRRYVVRLS